MSQRCGRAIVRLVATVWLVPDGIVAVESPRVTQVLLHALHELPLLGGVQYVDIDGHLSSEMIQERIDRRNTIPQRRLLEDGMAGPARFVLTEFLEARVVNS